MQIHVPPPHLDQQINDWTAALRAAFDTGDVAPQQTLRGLVGAIYADGHSNGYVAGRRDSLVVVQERLAADQAAEEEPEETPDQADGDAETREPAAE